MIGYRRAGVSDVDALVDFRIDFMRAVKRIDAAAESAWKTELAALFARELGSGALRAWVAVEGGRVVGASGLAPARGRDEREGEILNMYTLPGFRRRGIGASLLELAIGEARAAGLSRLRLQPTEDGRRLYEGAGFRDEDRDMVLDLAAKAEETHGGLPGAD